MYYFISNYITNPIQIFAVNRSQNGAIINDNTSRGAGTILPTDYDLSYVDHKQEQDVNELIEQISGSIPNTTSTSDIQFRDTQLGAVHYNDFTYHKTGESKGIVYYRCAKKRLFNCRANIKVSANGTIVCNRFNHNHAPKKQLKPLSILANKKLIFNGYGFHKHFENKRKTHWRCTNIKLTQCNVRLHTDNFGNIQVIRGVHNHKPNV